MFLGKRIEDLSVQDVLFLINEKVAESKILDYKEVFDFENEKKKEEIFKDIAAFHNTEGGVLIYGLAEERDGKTKLGIPVLPEENKIAIPNYV